MLRCMLYFRTTEHHKIISYFPILKSPFSEDIALPICQEPKGLMVSKATRKGIHSTTFIQYSCYTKILDCLPHPIFCLITCDLDMPRGC